MGLQNIYGHRKVVALLGNHEEMVMSGFSSVNEMLGSGEYDDSDDSYRYWFERLPRYHVEGNTIFVHAGIDEDSGNAWEYCTEDYIFTEQYPHRLGKIHGLDKRWWQGMSIPTRFQATADLTISTMTERVTTTLTEMCSAQEI